MADDKKYAKSYTDDEIAEMCRKGIEQERLENEALPPGNPDAHKGSDGLPPERWDDHMGDLPVNPSK